MQNLHPAECTLLPAEIAIGYIPGGAGATEGRLPPGSRGGETERGEGGGGDRGQSADTEEEEPGGNVSELQVYYMLLSIPVLLLC